MSKFLYVIICDLGVDRVQTTIGSVDFGQLGDTTPTLSLLDSPRAELLNERIRALRIRDILR